MEKRTEHAMIWQAIEKAPLLSSSAAQLLRLNSVPDHELSEVVDVIRYDLALTARLLKVVNSAAFGLMHPITSIDRAVAYLGERVLIGIAVSNCVGDLFHRPLEGYEGELDQLWHHGLFCAVAAREVVQHSRSPFPPDLAFTAGLLHDIGKSILSEYLKGSARGILVDIDNKEFPDYLSAEQATIGVDHAAVGHELATHWQLPEPLREAIRFHHQPHLADTDLRPLAYAVHLGDIIAMMGGYGSGCDSMQYQLDQGYTDYFDLSSEGLASLMLEVTEEFTKLNQSLDPDESDIEES